MQRNEDEDDKEAKDKLCLFEKNICGVRGVREWPNLVAIEGEIVPRALAAVLPTKQSRVMCRTKIKCAFIIRPCRRSLFGGEIGGLGKARMWLWWWWWFLVGRGGLVGDRL